jgi:hypothetical protein
MSFAQCKTEEQRVQWLRDRIKVLEARPYDMTSLEAAKAMRYILRSKGYTVDDSTG